MEPRAYIGTSGYSYKSWDKTFYGDTPKRLQLEYYATQFPTVEINATFYKLPTEGMVLGWRDRVDRRFVYAVKGSRFITHMKKLVRLNDGVDKYFDRIAPLKSRIGCVLWQLPGMLHKDAPRLDDFLAQLPRDYRHAVEFRHPSWYDDEIFSILARHQAAHVALSSLGMPMNLTVTTDFIYIRFHGLEGGAAHDYTRKELVPWGNYISEQAAAGQKLFVYFNNDINVRAPDNARMLMRMIGENAVHPPDSAEETPRQGRRGVPLVRTSPRSRRQILESRTAISS
jgi:uncharacterized protein YecE (DUF72 family)